MSTLRVQTSKREEMVDVTDRVRAAVRAAGVGEGICVVYSPHTTCGA